MPRSFRRPGSRAEDFKLSQYPDEVPALRVAFDALLPLADLARQAAVLRTALKALVADSDRAPAFHFAPRGPRVRKSGDGQWAKLRTRVRRAMATQRMSSTALAGVIGITHSTLQRIISPSSSPPGEKVIAPLQVWVDGQSIDRGDKGLSITQAISGNGAGAAAPPGLTPEQHAALGRLQAISDPAQLAERIELVPTRSTPRSKASCTTRPRSIGSRPSSRPRSARYNREFLHFCNGKSSKLRARKTR